MVLVTPNFQFSGNCEDAIHLYEKAFDTKEDVEKAFNVLKDGGEILIPLRKTTYSSCGGTLIDKYGIRWGLMTEQTE
jgi:uncharacterized glyoxalase superfamily protein PhnB